MIRILMATCLIVALTGCSNEPSERKALPHSSVAEKATTKERQNSPRKTDLTDKSVEALRLQHIRKVFNSYPDMQLPFHHKTQSSERLPRWMENTDRDTLLFDPNHMAAYIIGALPDTSRYFGVFYLSEADDLLLCFLAIDKKGMITERKILVESCWQGAESDCISISDIAKDLTIRFDYSEFLFPDLDENDFASVPDQASGYTTVSKVTSSGKVKLVKRTEKDSKELLQHPIIHE